MESLAYLHTALTYESDEPAPELRPLSDWFPTASSAAWLSAQVLAAALVVSAAGSAMAATGTVQTNGNPLNVRSTPGGPVVSSLPNGARVELTGRKNGNYLELANGTWVSADWVAVGGTSPTQPPSGTDRAVGFVNTAGEPLNVRSAPGGAIVGTLPNGTRVELTGRSSSGFLERTNSTWIDARYVTYSQSPTPSPNPTPNPGTGTGSGTTTSFVRTNGSPLNVRNAPGGAVVGTVANGSRVELTGRRSGEWAQRTNGTWVSSNWLTNSPGTP
ncbi:MAG: SH3 domain-containing protein, partial [Cyanobacteria bacterium J069]